jgi:urease accessory protein
MNDSMQMIAALRLASPALPIGGFSYSQGLESAIDRGWVTHEAQALDWIGQCLSHGVGRFEAPLLYRLCEAVSATDVPEVLRLNALYLASRETRELREETLQMGWSLVELLRGLSHGEAIEPMLPQGSAGAGRAGRGVTLPLAWALAARAFSMSAANALIAWLWAWLENQVMVTLKAVPLGQQAGQRLLGALSGPLARVAQQAPLLAEDQWSNFAPGLALACSWHETQYSRMFRS